MYSLVSPSVLCMDLIRHENALGVLDVLDRALTLTVADVPALRAVHREDAARDAAWLEVDDLCAAAPRMSDAVAAVRDHLAKDGLDALAGHGLAEQLSATPLFGLADLLTMVREDVLDWTWDRIDDVAVQRHPAAVAVVADAVAAAYARGQLSVQSYARLGGPWAQLTRERPVALPAGAGLGPQAAVMHELVERLARLDEADFAGLERAATAARTSGADWSRAMHAATWAAYVSDRLRTVARAQLVATRSLVLAGLTPLAASSGVMRVVTAAVQAVVVADVLDSPTHAALVAPWESVFGLLG
ncbi:MAG: hypothetical protein ACJ74O_09050 [Frankiaceae bacterium]